MTETVMRLSGVAIIAVFSSFFLKERQKAASVAVTLAAVAIIIAVSLDEGIRPGIEAITSFALEGDFSSYAATLLKALGIAYIATITESICREAGEGTLASAVELCAKAQLILLALPLVSSLLEIAGKLL